MFLSEELGFLSVYVVYVSMLFSSNILKGLFFRLGSTLLSTQIF